MNASGNRGDDIRALRLCEMQPYEFLHPNGETTIFAVLGLQSDQEHKARSKAMRTVGTSAFVTFIFSHNLCADNQSHIHLLHSPPGSGDVSNWRFSIFLALCA